MNYVIGIVNLVSSQKYFNMRNFYSKLFFLLLPAIASCQLYVGDANTNSYVYNSGEIVFVTQDVNLQGAPDQDEGNFYLRNEGQLIQGEDASTNDGEGVISVFQQNTRNKWDYHYWSSPVGDPLYDNPDTNRYNYTEIDDARRMFCGEIQFDMVRYTKSKKWLTNENQLQEQNSKHPAVV